MADNVFYNESDLPLAKETRVVEIELDHGVKVYRKVVEGTRVPPDLIEAYDAATTSRSSAKKTTGDKAGE